MGQPVFLVEFNAKVLPRFLRSGAPHADGTRYEDRQSYPINSSLGYRVGAKCRRSASADGQLYIGVIFLDSAGLGITFATYAATAVTPPTSWQTYTGTFGFGLGGFPAGAVRMYPVAWLNYASSAGVHDCMELWIEDTATDTTRNRDRYFRDPAQRFLNFGSVGQYLTLTDGGEALAQTLALRYATGAYVTHAADTPAMTPYEARVQHPGLVRSELPADWVGQISGSYGEVVLSNVDGALSDWTYYGLNGQDVAVLYGQDDAPRSSFVRVVNATIQQAVVDRQAVRLRLMGPESRLSAPLLTVPRAGTLARGTRFLGNNALPNGIEGTAADLIGLPRPRLYGKVKNIAPPCVNTSRQIYEVHNVYGGTLYGGPTPESIAVSTVRVRGLALTAGAAYTSQSDMETNAPAAGAYRVWAEGGMFRLGTVGPGLVTCDAEMWPSFFDAGRTGWQDLAALILYEAIGYPLRIDFDQAVYDPPDNWTGAGQHAAGRGVEAGVWVNDLRSAAEVLHTICASAGAWFGFIEWGGIISGDTLALGFEVFPPALSTYPGLASVPAFDDSNVLAASSLPDPGPRRGLPVGVVDLGYAPNATVMTGDFDAGVSAADRAVLAAPMTRVSAGTGVTVMNERPFTLVKNTALTAASSAADEAERLFHLTRFPKVWIEIQVHLQAVLEMSTKPRLGAYVKLSLQNLAVLTADGVTSGWGYFTVQALECDFKNKRVRMTLRQATEQTRA